MVGNIFEDFQPSSKKFLATSLYNNIYHSTIKMKPVEVKWNTCINSIKEINNEDPKFQIGHNVRISK